MKDRDALDAVREAAQWFAGRSDGVAERPADVLPALPYLIGDAGLVLIGEATHGTDEFYSIRAARTKVLKYLHKIDPAARARHRYSCFE